MAKRSKAKAKKSKAAKKKQAVKKTKAVKKKKSAKKSAKKRQTVKKKKTAKPRVDPCAQEERDVDSAGKKVDELREDLSDRDIPADLRERLEQLLERAEAEQTRALKALDACRAENPK
jgi:hypothetical protein